MSRRTRPSRDAVRRTPAGAPSVRPPRPPAPLSDAASRAWTLAAWALAAVFAALLLALDFGPHRLGDYFTETDFYGAYAAGARALQHGHLDPARYGVIGPVYELLLALVGFAAPGLFAAANALSLAAAVATLALWFFLLRRLFDARLAFFACLFLASNVHFFRYGWAAATDAPALALQSAAIYLLLTRRGRAGVLAAGLVAGLACLTRYNAGALLPAGISIALLGGAPAGRGRAALWFSAGFAAPVAAWLAVSAGHGGAPGGELFHNIAYEVYAHARGLTWDEYEQRLQPTFHGIGGVVAADPGAFFARMAFNLFDHVRLDLHGLLGWPVAVAAVLGVFVAWQAGVLRRLWPVAVAAGMFYLTLVPVAHSERYSLPLLPMYAALAAAAFALPLRALAANAWAARAQRLLVWIPVGLAAMACESAQAFDVVRLPREVLEATGALRPLARPGDRILARKPHLAFHAGLEDVPFPFTNTWSDLAAYARQRQVRWLYFSYAEAETRTEYAVLLDTTAHVPGLTARWASNRVGAVLYEIGPAFGESPAWAADRVEQVRHEALARLKVSSRNAEAMSMLGRIESSRGHLAAARQWLEQAVAAAPDSAEYWGRLGDVCVNSGDARRAGEAFERAQELSPGDPTLQLKRGWTEMMSGRPAQAALLWRPMVAQTRDPMILSKMVEVFEAAGDSESARAARSALEAAGGSR